MSKHIDSVPKLTEFRPPWQTADGTEVEINKETLTKFIHNLITDKAKALDSRDEAKAEAEKVATERDELKSQADSKDPDSAGKIAKAEQKAKDAEAAAVAAELRADRAEVAAEKGLTPAQAKRLQGSTKDELAADADEFIKDLAPAKSDDEDEEGEEAAGRLVPRGLNLNNGGDPAPTSTQEPDYEKLAAQILPGRNI